MFYDLSLDMNKDPEIANTVIGSASDAHIETQKMYHTIDNA